MKPDRWERRRRLAETRRPPDWFWKRWLKIWERAFKGLWKKLFGD